MKYTLLLLFLSGFSFGAGGNVAETDIVQRIINFVIFIAILWYFVADKLKELFVSRRQTISEKLDVVQDKLRSSKKEKEQVLRRLEEARETAADIVATAKREAYLAIQKIDEQSKMDIEHIIKNNEVLMGIEQKKVEREVADEILLELFKTKTSILETSEYIGILNKRVLNG